MESMTDYFNREAKLHDDHFLNRMGMAEFYDEIERQLSRCDRKDDILVLGCGTGLEIERIKFDSRVTALDISPEMLRELEKKKFYPGVRLKPVCASLLAYDFGKEAFDLVLTCYTLHHFHPGQKQEIYAKISACLKPGGIFLCGDTMSQNNDEEKRRLSFAEDEYRSQKKPFGSLHIDLPLTFERERVLLRAAGFARPELLREWEKTKLFRCVKE